MKRNHKKAFTLTEILISLSVIGIVAATIIPLANKYKPDEDKVKYLQTYDSITHTVKRMAQDETAFPVVLEEGGTRFNVSKLPFMHSGNVFCQNFVQGLNVVETGLACTQSGNLTRTEFVTKNGVAWSVEIDRSLSGRSGHFLATVDLWLDGDRTNDNKHHTLHIGPNGKVAIRDEKGLYYHGTRALWRKAAFREEEWTDIENVGDVDPTLDYIDEIDENTTPEAWVPVDDPVVDNGGGAGNGEESASDSASDSSSGSGNGGSGTGGSGGGNGGSGTGGSGTGGGYSGGGGDDGESSGYGGDDYGDHGWADDGGYDDGGQDNGGHDDAGQDDAGERTPSVEFESVTPGSWETPEGEERPICNSAGADYYC